jgi:uncharacterized protein (DUF1501 family)
LSEVNRQRARLDSAATEQAFDGQHAAAVNLLTSGKVTQAFDIDREPAGIRDQYGRHLFGQSLLLARRLVQAGVPIIQANMGIVQTWDTHDNNFVKLKDRLLPPLDRGVSALLDDLLASGLLDETLVVMVGEFGRSPRISAAGRDHWPACYTSLLAGAGIRGGLVYGASDAQGAYVKDRPVSPETFGATLFHALGVSPDMRFGPDGFSFRVSDGEPLVELFS